MERERKHQVAQILREKAQRARAAILAEFSGIPFEDLTRMRDAARAQRGEFKVVKNRLFERATQGLAIAALKDHFSGSTAVVFCYDDPIAVVQALRALSKEPPPLFRPKAAWVEGEVLDAKGLEALALLPGRAALQGRVVGLLKAPALRTVLALKGLPLKLVRILKAAEEKRRVSEGAAAPGAPPPAA